MAVSVGTKARRLATFLIAMRNPRILLRLAAKGFGPVQVAEGWNLLKAVSMARLDTSPIGEIDDGVVDALDDWENEWFPVILATLKRHYPDVGERVFLNLRQTEGNEVIFSVGTLTERVRALDSDSATDRDKAARKLLVTRGLTEQALAAVEGRLAQLRQALTPLEPADADERAKLAEESAWGYYLEWSAIARQMIKNRRHLREMGFLDSRGNSVSEEAETEEENGAVK